MFFEEVIFNNSEVNLIKDFTNTYTNLSSYPLDEVKPNNRIEYISPSFTKLYTTYSIPFNEDTFWLFKKLRDWLEFKTTKKLLPCSLEKGIVSRVLTIQKYSVGDKFEKHLDITTSPPYKNRRFNLGVSLNSDYEGGEYILYYNDDQEYIFDKKLGNAIGYDISYFHEVKEITKGERWSLVYPLYQNDFIEEKKLF